MFDNVGTTEADLENAMIERLAEMQGWEPAFGTDINPGVDRGRETLNELAIPARMLDALRKLNPQVPIEYLEQARGAVLAPESLDPIAENFRVHKILVHGYRGITYTDHHGVEQNPTIRFVGARVEDNDFLAVQQVRITSRDHDRRFDVVLYLNGMPVVIAELKRPGAVNADIASAHAQLATYREEFPMAFRFAVLTVISDGVLARYGTPFTRLNHYSPWNVDDSGEPLTGARRIADEEEGIELDYLVDGVLNTERFLQLQRNYVAFDSSADGLHKRIAKPHQYFAVSKAVGCTVEALRSDGRAGVVWHTQGSGKSMEMELYTHLVGTRPELKNPTVVVVTDRNELDGQLFEAFQRSELLPEEPKQIGSRSELREKLADRQTGGIFFTTLQKFGLTKEEKESGLDHPLLSDRSNIVIVVDEAHRSHYETLNGYAAHLRAALPNATRIAFTGTPISFEDRNTVNEFGNHIDVYDLVRAVDDGATVGVIFEPRLPEVLISEGVSDAEIDLAADAAVLGLDEAERAKIEGEVTVLNALYGAPERLEAVAKDLVAHWKARREAMSEFIGGPGKALIVCATREICADLYAEIIKLEPEWASDANAEGVIKVVYSGSASDPANVRKHVRRESENKSITNRLKVADDPLELVIVQNMLLTGFDAPPLHTLYLDRPMQGALLMQTLARVNRTFEGKPNGLVVAYAPIADNLERALKEFTRSAGREQPVKATPDAVIAATRELVARLDDLCSGYPWRSKLGGKPGQYFRVVNGLLAYLRSPTTPGNQDEPTLADRFRSLSNELKRAWAVSHGAQNLADIAPVIKFYEEVRVWMAKYDAEQRKAEGRPVPAEIKRVLDKLVADSTASGRIIDIYEAAGMPKPSLTDLTPEFEEKAKNAEHPHLAIEALRAVLTEEVRQTTRNNLARQKAFSERLRELMNRYTNQQLTSAEVIAALIELAREASQERNRGAQFSPPLSSDELSFYDALHENDSAVTELGDDTLIAIVKELIKIMRNDIKTDWTVRDDVRAKLRSTIRRLLVKYKYPPDRQPDAIRLVIDQMEVLAPMVAAERLAARG
ncbi:type I restriction endonuclease subunit R [Nocardia camponoti]|uniref:Type I restriction enzyme endonuclease subunit n=1 Tax=Nocardia camponoti TaxID=1616106 RepID=A0A917QJ92_9NOCA|nr:type I restriction endonuclease subunit R [Nocardia camponoti]GGK53300.1 DEAD/DEAH box helicase [Nocardia camponoti]